MTDHRIAVLKRGEVCPMPYALCPMPYAHRVPHVTEKGYITIIPSLYVIGNLSNCSDNATVFVRHLRTYFSF
ncbi:hypothetical protein [Microcoleus sp.]|uniref:hypothetical protein n=1 Tax=Microcoleus sp. TaxID=44472 RepID=UPI00403EEBAA